MFHSSLVHDPQVGPAGSRLEEIEEATGGRIIVNDTGEVEVYAPTARQYSAAISAVKEVEGANVKEGQVYNVQVGCRGSTVVPLKCCMARGICAKCT